MHYQLRDSILPIQPNYSTIEKVFAARGLTPDDLEHYLHTTDADIIDPTRLCNVKEGATMLIKHIAANDPMTVIVDCDADGYTSAALFINYLNCLFPAYVRNHITYKIHSGKQHGIEMKLVPEDTKILVVPDAGSNDYKQHAALKARGCDVLVLDHHMADYISDDACIINNQLCDYPTKSLSGVGVVYKFCSYIDQLMNYDYADQFLDLAAVGMIADVMDLRDFETHQLITKGLKNIRNPFLREMVQMQNYSISKAGGLCPFSVSFYIAPQINATIREGTFDEKLMLFESMLDFKAYEQIPSTKRGCSGQLEPRVDQACRNCASIKRRQAKAVDKSLEIVDQEIQDNHLDNNKIIAVVLDRNEAAPELTGLIANKIASKWDHPTLLLLDDEQGNLSGSGRNYPNSIIKDFRQDLIDSKLVTFAEG